VHIRRQTAKKLQLKFEAIAAVHLLVDRTAAGSKIPVRILEFQSLKA
jgi:hypothetical protein